MKVVIAFCLLLSTVSTSFAGAASTWHSLGFNGNGFATGAASGAVMVRDGYLPAPAGASVPENPLPAGDGAVALFCYQQQSGGKIRRTSSFIPMSGVAVTVVGNSFTIAGRTDETGYLILALPPGKYQFIIAGLPRGVTVERGKTALVAVRGSKRMVD